MPLSLTLNGHIREFGHLVPPVSLVQLVSDLALKADRIAVELNGEIVQRSRWPETTLGTGDRLEVIHFVGGGR